jgi:hypothetical protein
MKLLPKEQELFNQCLGKCDICMVDGACKLQKKLYNVKSAKRIDKTAR